MLLAGDFIPKSLPIKLPDRFGRELVLANLEGPVCADGLPGSTKVGVHLHSAPFDIPGRWAFSLANNHLMDFREEGLRQTRCFLAKKGYAFAGAGDGEDEARKPMFLEEEGKRIAVFSCCERQFGMATPNSAGVAAMGVWLYEAIRSIKSRGKADFVIVSCHAASEFCSWPSPQLRAFYHSLVDAGADVIHGHHAHVPQGWETYRNRPIFFGLGNFVVDPAMWSANRNQLWSLVADVRFTADGVSFSVTPYCISLEDAKIVLHSVAEEASVGDYLVAANAPFAPDSAVSVEAIWQEASARLYPRIYAQGIRAPGVARQRLSMRDRVRKVYFALRDVGYALLGREWATPKSLFYAKGLYCSYNCRSHYEMIATALGVLTKVEPDVRTDASHSLVARCMGEC